MYILHDLEKGLQEGASTTRYTVDAAHRWKVVAVVDRSRYNELYTLEFQLVDT